jgi:hypothetical protein
MTADISALLDDWPYDADHNVRVVSGPSGRRLLQIRIEQGAFQGILQMDLDGRPDGRRPYQRNFAFDHFRAKLRAYRHLHGGDEGFLLNHKQCEELFDESRRVYERYVFLLQLGDYKRVVRDTERNMDVFRFVNSYAESAADRTNLEKWWPYIIRINAQARALLALKKEDVNAALTILGDAQTRIEELTEVDAEEFGYERTRSLQALRQMTEELAKKQPMSPAQRLEKQLQKAVAEERFEQAAVLRDRLRHLREADAKSAG